MTRITFACPACLRRVHRMTVSDVADEVHDRRCPKCRVKWRFIVHPIPLRGGIAHAVTNTTRLPCDAVSAAGC